MHNMRLDREKTSMLRNNIIKLLTDYAELDTFNILSVLETIIVLLVIAENLSREQCLFLLNELNEIRKEALIEALKVEKKKRR